MSNFLPTRKAAQALGMHPNTVRKYADEGKIKHIKTNGNQRRYDVSSFISENSEMQTICYCRVSSKKQSDDLQRQISFMQQNYPHATIVSDIASALNFKRKGLNSILERLMQGDKLTIVVAHKDRLARFGYELIEFLVNRNGGKILVLNSNVQNPQQELATDILAILHVFSCRIHGLRKYHNQIKKDILETNQSTEESTGKLDGNFEVCL